MIPVHADQVRSIKSAMENKIIHQQDRPKVGVGVMIVRDGKILLGKRKASHGKGEYAFPGGHLEYMESFEDCARREVNEECGIKIKNIQFQFLANVTAYTPKHYVHIGLLAGWENGEPKALEPEKSESWNWYAIDDVPEPIFKMCQIAMDSYRTGKKYYDIFSIDYQNQ